MKTVKSLPVITNLDAYARFIRFPETEHTHATAFSVKVKSRNSVCIKLVCVDAERGKDHVSPVLEFTAAQYRAWCSDVARLVAYHFSGLNEWMPGVVAHARTADDHTLEFKPTHITGISGNEWGIASDGCGFITMSNGAVRVFLDTLLDSLDALANYDVDFCTICAEDADAAPVHS